jgi:hypothetical protein
MVTAGTSVSYHTRALPGRSYDDVFFSGMALLILVTVFVGFARTYYLAGLFRAPLPSLVVHLHGAAFSCWIVLLIVQTSLIAARRVDIHRRLGIAGFTLACLMVVLGIWVNNRALARDTAPPDADRANLYFLGMALIFVFGVLMLFAFHSRSTPAVHKRLIFIATVALLPAATGRLPLAFVSGGIRNPSFLSYMFLLLLVVYDLWSIGKVHRATLAAAIFLIFTEQITMTVGHTASAQSFADMMYAMLRLRTN